MQRSFGWASLVLVAGLVLGWPSSSWSVTFVVDDTGDTSDAAPGDGTCADANGACTLRAAAEESFAGAVTPPCDTADTDVQLQVTGTIALAAPVSFQSACCLRAISIVGPGSSALVLEGGGLSFGGSGCAGYRADVTGVTIASAPVGIDDLGAGIGFATGLTLSDVVLADNDVGLRLGFRSNAVLNDSTVSGSTGNGIGPNDDSLVTLGVALDHTSVVDNGADGIAHQGFSLALQASTVARNGGTGVDSLAMGWRSVSVVDSTIAGNGDGGLFLMLADASTVATVTGSTIADNHGTGLAAAAGDLHVVNSTISGNATHGDGGGLYLDYGHVLLEQATITDNDADLDGDGTGDGGGVFIGIDGTVEISGTVLARNRDHGGEAPDCGGSLASLGHNLVGASAGCTLTGGAGSDMTGVDPLLGPLADNGGPTRTHALVDGSPAIDAAGTCAVGTDQRGVSRPQGPACDIGAFESSCGNGTIDPGETCDDGNANDADCCAKCQLAPAGAACSDGDPCMANDTCDAAGACVAGTMPGCGPCETCGPSGGCVPRVMTACHGPTERLSGVLEVVPGKHPKLDWSWVKGESTALADFGNPVGGDRYGFCVFDESGLTPRTLLQAATRVGQCGRKPCWRATSASTFTYKDTKQTPDGIDYLFFKSGLAGKAKVDLAAKGQNLDLPALPLPLPLHVQLQGANGQCWEARYFQIGTTRNDAKHFRAKAFRP